MGALLRCDTHACKSTDLYITRNRLGIFIFQYKTPARTRASDLSMHILFGRSLHTRNRMIALKRARKLAMPIDDIENKYLHDSASYVKAMELLMKYEEALAAYPDRQDCENNFLTDHDENEDYLLEKAVQYEKETKLTCDEFIF